MIRYRIPPSKSHTLRALLFGLMGKGKSIIRNPLVSPDTQAMCQAIAQFGATIVCYPDRWEVEGTAGKLKPAEDVIQAGNSGQILRFIAALAALQENYTVITGDHSIRHNRPIAPLLDALTQLGALASSTRLDGYAPIVVRGPIQPGTASLSGEDSQPVSALLIAASFLKGTTEIHVENPGERPWIDLTLYWLDRLGISYENRDYQHYTLFGHADYEGFDIVIPSDFSSAAYPITAALLTSSEITLENIDMSDVQGDKKLIEVLISMGANIEIDSDKKELIVKKGSSLQGQKIDVNDFIDATPILAVIGCFAKGTTEIVGAAIARKKESDRLHAITTELKKMGANIEEKEDGLVITSASLQGAQLKTHDDHRIALSLCVAAAGARGQSHIEGIHCIAKSYPSFLTDLKRLITKS